MRALEDPQASHIALRFLNALPAFYDQSVPEFQTALGSAVARALGSGDDRMIRLAVGVLQNEKLDGPVPRLSDLLERVIDTSQEPELVSASYRQLATRQIATGRFRDTLRKRLLPAPKWIEFLDFDDAVAGYSLLHDANALETADLDVLRKWMSLNQLNRIRGSQLLGQLGALRFEERLELWDIIDDKSIDEVRRDMAAQALVTEGHLTINESLRILLFALGSSYGSYSPLIADLVHVDNRWIPKAAEVILPDKTAVEDPSLAARLLHSFAIWGFEDERLLVMAEALVLNDTYEVRRNALSALVIWGAVEARHAHVLHSLFPGKSLSERVWLGGLITKVDTLSDNEIQILLSTFNEAKAGKQPHFYAVEAAKVLVGAQVRDSSISDYLRLVVADDTSKNISIGDRFNAFALLLKLEDVQNQTVQDLRERSVESEYTSTRLLELLDQFGALSGVAVEENVEGLPAYATIDDRLLEIVSAHTDRISSCSASITSKLLANDLTDDRLRASTRAQLGVLLALGAFSDEVVIKMLSESIRQPGSHDTLRCLLLIGTADNDARAQVAMRLLADPVAEPAHVNNLKILRTWRHFADGRASDLRSAIDRVAILDVSSIANWTAELAEEVQEWKMLIPSLAGVEVPTFPESPVVSPGTIPQYLLFTVGSLLLVMLLVVALWRQHEELIYFLVRLLTSLGTAAVISAIPGFIGIRLEPGTQVSIEAGGAVAGFAIVYFLNPAQLKRQRRRSGKNSRASSKAV